MAALQYLESQRNAHPELAEWYNSLADLYQKKLWHQLTLKLEQFIALSVFQVNFFPYLLEFTSSCSFSGKLRFIDLEKDGRVAML